MKNNYYVLVFLCIALTAVSCTNQTEKNEVNVYTHRHYEIDQQLFAKFTEETGIEVNVINASADELIERIANEGEQSPADVLITVDAGRLNRAHQRGLLQPVSSEILETTVPEHLRDPQGHWFGVTYRARIIAYAKDRVDPTTIERYEDLAGEQWKGKVLVRTSDNVYNQSLLASMVIANGADAATNWAKGIVANFAREPKGNDRDQIKGIAGGEGDLAIVNTYYIGLMLHSENSEEQQAAQNIGIIFPNQNDRGTHVNVSGAGVAAHAPNKDNAIRLIEFLLSEDVQAQLSSFNFEYPVNASVPATDLLQSWGDFKKDQVNLAALGEHNEEAVKIFDQVGWK